MLKNKSLPIILLGIFILALVLSIKYLGPKSAQVQSQDTEQEFEATKKVSQSDALSNEPNLPRLQVLVPEQEKLKPELPALSEELQAVKDGKTSIMTSILSGTDLNAQLTELLAISAAGEVWADYAIGQLAEMCTYLHETPETQLIQMFTATNRGISPSQQAQFSELMPVVLDASKRCKTMDGGQLSALGNPRDWFDRAAEANQPSAFVSNGFSLISARLRAEDATALANLSSESNELDIQKQREAIRTKAKAEYREQVRENFASGKMNPEALMSMAEHLNLFYDGDHPLKSKEAWMLLACDQGFEKNCARESKAMDMFCMFDPACQTGGDFQQGIVWQQGQFKYDEHRRTADELKQIFANKDWDKLGF